MFFDTFYYDGEHRPVEFIETEVVKDGVICDVYKFVGVTAYDLAIVRVSPGVSTPLQWITGGREENKTVEGVLEGTGTLLITGIDNNPRVSEGVPKTTVLHGTDQLQWTAGKEGLTFFEICHPPYEDGRYVNVMD